MTTMVNWRMMTKAAPVGARIDQLFDTVFNRGDLVAYEHMTAMGWKAIDHQVALPDNPAAPWLAASRVAAITEPARPEVAAPRVDVTEIPSGLLIEIRLPRLVRESVYIGVRDNILTVTGEQALPTPAGAAFDQGGRRFQRNFPLPPASTRHRINAFCQGEMLRIIISKDTRSN